MKARLVLFTLASFLFFSCNNDNDTSNSQSSTKVIKKMTLMSYYEEDTPTYTEVRNYSYKNGEISKIIFNASNTNMNNENYSLYEYDGNKITKITSYYNNVLSSILNLYYDGDNLSYTTVSDKDGTESEGRNVYNYDTQGKPKTAYWCWSPVPTDCFNENPYTYEFSGNNLSNEFNVQIGDGATVTYEYSYDTKNNPFKNQNKYYRLLANGYSYTSLSENNPVTRKTRYSWDTTTNQEIEYTITYDNDNFPITVVGKHPGSNENWITYKFEYQQK